jgi:hypothetical protein
MAQTDGWKVTLSLQLSYSLTLGPLGGRLAVPAVRLLAR